MTMKKIFMQVIGLSRLVKAVLVLALANMGIFTVKSYLFGLKGYYIIQLSASVAIIAFIVVFYILNTSNLGIYAKFVNMHGTFFKNISSKAYAYCVTNNKSIWTWIGTSLCFVHLVAISFITLLTWNCTTYVRVTAALAFVGFITGVVALRIQSKTAKLEAAKKQEYNEGRLPRPSEVIPILREQHPYHIVPNSVWPAVTAFFIFEVLVFTVKYFHYGLTQYIKHHIIMSAILFLLAITCWLWNVTQEANEGHHTKNVRWNLLHGFVLFIASEVMLFFAIFWSFFHSSLSPSVAIYCTWPPLGIETIDPFGLPFLNTVLLISSGLTLTVSHRALAAENPDYSLTSTALIQTLALGAAFTCVQGFEYIHAPFAMNDGIYGSVFYFATGFHGLHVIVGSIMLLVSLIRNALRQLSGTQHVGFLCSIWYWHFVDIVWIFLFITIYWWGS